MPEKETSKFEGLKMRPWAISLVVVIATGMSGAWWSLDKGLRDVAKEFIEFKGDMKTSNAVTESQMKTLNNALKRLEGRIDVDNQTRYTAGEARRDFAVVGHKLEDHESRIRALEKKGPQ